MTWITNSHEAAEALRRADKRWQDAREAEKHLPLTEKVKAYRAAKARREADYTLISAGAFDRV